MRIITLLLAMLMSQAWAVVVPIVPPSGGGGNGSVSTGGTGLTALTAYGIMAGGTTSTGNMQQLPVGTAGQVLISGGSTALPSWSTVTGTGTLTSLGIAVPAFMTSTGGPITTAGTITLGFSGALPVADGGTNSTTPLSGSSIMVSDGTHIVQGSAGTTTTVLHGNASGAASFSAVALATDVSGTLGIANGGTGSGTAPGAFAALAPLATLGDTLYESGSGPTVLPGNTVNQAYFLQQQGTGTVSAAPAWGPITAGQIPNLPASVLTSGLLQTNRGGWGIDVSAAANGAIGIGTGSGIALGVPTGTSPVVVTTGSGTLNFSLATVTVPNGGTGQSTLTPYAPLFAGTTSTGALQQTALGTAGWVLTSNGPGALATMQAPSGGVASLNGLTGALNIAAGTGITVTPSGTTVTITATGGGGGATVFADNVFAVQNASDATKQLEVSLGGATTGTALTLVSAQTANANLTIPNIVSGGDTFATLKQGNAYTGSNTWGTSVTPIAITEGAASSGAPPSGFSYVGAAHTGLTAGSAGTAEVLFNGAQTKTWAGGASVTNWRFAEFDGPVMAAASAETFTSPATVWINGPPTTGANATVSAPYSLYVNAGNVLFKGALTMNNTGNNILVSQVATSSGAASLMTVNAASLTNQTTTVEVTDVNFNLSHTIQHATGAIALDRTFLIQAPTHTAVAASVITTADTVNITGVPIASTNVTITTANALHVGGRTQIDGNLSLGVAGAKQLITEGSNASMGLATLVGGTVTVSDTLITANTRVFYSVQTAGGTQGFLHETQSVGTSFTITSTSGTETSTVAWHLIEPGP